MELNSVNATVPTDRQTMATENREPRQTETRESVPQENREAYRVEISRQAMEAASTQEPAASGPENSEAVQAYNSAGRIAG